MDALDADGLEVRPEERAALAAAHEFGWLAGILPVIHRAMDMGALSPSAAADARRMVRGILADGASADTASAEARYHAATAPTWDRTYRMDSDAAGYTHLPCGSHFGPFVDSVQLTDHRAAHHHACEAVRDV
ncbi:hypothetical protein [Nocardiopsis sp. NRRL B-16309]|uniref:hypothetical protein n=1 Tax=Nocardiopsis sp. NRRL B-16309 TaxID=1519494 RepID=UPI0012E298A7|nr:hypothetical protein [Nocardiopsis sp. NRRL B-16309]